MSGFLYAIKKAGPAPQDKGNVALNKVLESIELEHLIGMEYAIDSRQFPDAGPVWLMTPYGYGVGASGASHKIDLANQRWVDCGHFNIGYWTAGGYAMSPPKPTDLQRKRVFGSITLTLGDGFNWLFPVIPISAEGKQNLVDIPTVLTIDRGKPEIGVSEFFKPLTGLVEKYWNWKKVAEPTRSKIDALKAAAEECYGVYKQQMATESPSEDEVKSAFESMKKYEEEIEELSETLKGTEYPELERTLDCCTVLSRNYHVSAYELGMMGTLDARAVRGIIMYAFLDKAAVDLQELAEKKG